MADAPSYGLFSGSLFFGKGWWCFFERNTLCWRQLIFISMSVTSKNSRLQDRRIFWNEAVLRAIHPKMVFLNPLDNVGWFGTRFHEQKCGGQYKKCSLGWRWCINRFEGIALKKGFSKDSQRYSILSAAWLRRLLKRTLFTKNFA